MQSLNFINVVKRIIALVPTTYTNEKILRQVKFTLLDNNMNFKIIFYHPYITCHSF